MEETINIFAACMNGSVEVVQQLIANGVDVNEPRFSTQCTPLHLASIAGKRRVVKLLLKNGALVDAVDKDGHTALHHAVVRANVSAVASPPPSSDRRRFRSRADRSPPSARAASRV